MTFFASVAGLVDAYNLGPLELWRAGPPTQNEFGEFVATTPVASDLDPAVGHTVTGRELERLPEADRSRETIRLYTTERLYAGDDGNTPDRVVYDGRTYRVSVSEPYGPHGAVYMAMAVLEETTDPEPAP